MILTKNSKTGWSLDFDRKSTCEHNCRYCYVTQMEKIYPAYYDKVVRNGKMAKWQNGKMIKMLNEELEKKKLKTPLRVYGGGDFQPEHMEIFRHIATTCYIISKNLTLKKNLEFLKELISIKNVTRILLSYDTQTLHRNRPIIESDKIKYCFTGEVEQYKEYVENKFNFDIYFNVRKTKAAKAIAAFISIACPCDAGCIKHDLACLQCRRCWESYKIKNLLV